MHRRSRKDQVGTCSRTKQTQDQVGRRKQTHRRSRKDQVETGKDQVETRHQCETKTTNRTRTQETHQDRHQCETSTICYYYSTAVSQVPTQKSWNK